jgi:hypothetical protein
MLLNLHFFLSLSDSYLYLEACAKSILQMLTAPNASEDASPHHDADLVRESFCLLHGVSGKYDSTLALRDL